MLRPVGVGGALTRNSRGALVDSQGVWSGQLQTGAPLQFWWNYNSFNQARSDQFGNGGHSVIFDRYEFGNNNSISGFYYTDYSGVGSYVPINTSTLVIGANLIDN